MSSPFTRRTSLPAFILGALLIGTHANAQIRSTSVAKWASANNVVSLAPGSSLSISAFKTEIESAFTAGSGGTIAFDDYGANSTPVSSVISSYNGGRSTLAITTSGTVGTVNTGYFSGSSGTTVLGFDNDASARTFTFGPPLSVVGLVCLSRGENRTVTLAFTLEDNSTVTLTDTVSASADNTLFNYKAPAGTNIVSVTISMPDGFARFDDFAFVTAAPKTARQARAQPPVPDYLYRWSFETGGMPEVKMPDRIRGGELVAISGNIDQLPVLQRRTGGVSDASPGVLNASRNAYGNLDGSQVASIGSNLLSGKTLDQFTITMWIKASLPTDMQPQARLINIGPPDGEQGKNSIFIALEGDSFAFCVNNSVLNKVELTVTKPVVRLNEWVFLVFTYDGTTENAYYSSPMDDRFQKARNGIILAGGLDQPPQLIAWPPVHTGAPSYSATPGKVQIDGLQMAIGSSNVRFDRSFVGWIDDVRIYNRIMNIDELNRVRLEATGK